MYNKISNSMFYKEEGIGLIKTMEDDKVLLIMKWFHDNLTMRGYNRFNLEDMIIDCGYKIDKRKNGNNDKFKMLLGKLQENNIIECESDLSKIKPKENTKIYLNLDLSQCYFELHDEEYNTIMNCDEEVDNLKLLTVYCYIKSRMYKRAKEERLELGAKAETCYPSYDNIEADLNVTDGVIKKYLDMLKELNLIRWDNAGEWYSKSDKDKVYNHSNNTYALYKDGWEDEIKTSIKAYKKFFSDTRVFVKGDVDKNTTSNINKLNGKKGYITKKINNNTATNEDLEELENIQDKIDNLKGKNNKRNEVKSLLDNNETNELLSTIYADKCKEDLADKIWDLEVKLGLIDEESNELLVEYKYYKWIITNYKEEENQYYINCINKHKKENVVTESVDKLEDDKDDIFAEFMDEEDNNDDMEYTIEEMNEMREQDDNSRMEDDSIPYTAEMFDNAEANFMLKSMKIMEKRNDIIKYANSEYIDLEPPFQKIYDKQFGNIIWENVDSIKELDKLQNELTGFFEEYSCPF